MPEFLDNLFTKLKENSKGSQFVIIAVTTLLLVAGWANVIWQYFTIEEAIITSFQEAQLEIVRSAALAAKEYANDHLGPDSTLEEIDRIEIEIQARFIQPIQLLDPRNTAWIIGSDNTMVFDESVDFVYHDKSIADFLPLQGYHCQASDFKHMLEDVLERREGTGKYIWIRHRTPWQLDSDYVQSCNYDPGNVEPSWSITGGLNQGWEIGAWTPVEVTSETKWMIGMTTKLTDIRRETGAAESVFLSVVTMSFVTVIVISFVFYSLRSRRQVVQLQQQVVDLQIKIDKVEKARQVEAIVDTDYFKGLRDQAKTLREGSRRRRPSRGNKGK